MERTLSVIQVKIALETTDQSAPAQELTSEILWFLANEANVRVTTTAQTIKLVTPTPARVLATPKLGLSVVRMPIAKCEIIRPCARAQEDTVGTH